jgi:hypothetical protein
MDERCEVTVVTTPGNAAAPPMTLDARLDRIESLLASLVDRERTREWYSVEEFSRIVGRAEFTCREWCRHGRINAEKKESGRGKYTGWAISHVELIRFQREGLLPQRHPAA